MFSYPVESTNKSLKKGLAAPDPTPMLRLTLQRKTCACGRPIVAGGECTECRKKRLALQRPAVNQSGPATAPPVVQEVLRSPGRPLDTETRAFMEPRFGQDFSGIRTHFMTPQLKRPGLSVGPAKDHYEKEADQTADTVMRARESEKLINKTAPKATYDFSQVRVHTGVRAAESAHAVNALAYTVGRDVVFGVGQYAPRTVEGKRLLAHELTHVLQQAGGNKQRIQRYELENDPDTAPSMTCAVARSSPAGVSLDVTFSINSSTLSETDQGVVSNFVRNWHLTATAEPVRIDGYASIDGSPSINWPLSCQRAETLANELITPSDGSPGIPASNITVFAQGETEQFGPALEPNRRAQAHIPTAPPGPHPPPTPSGPPAPERPGCRTTKSVTIDLIKLSGSNRDPASDLAFANTVYRQCCVRFVKRGEHTATRAETRRWLGGNRDLQRIHSCSLVHQEEKDLRENATARFGLASRYKVFYVRSMTPRLRGVNFSPDCSSGDRAPFNRHLYVANSAVQRTLAHELGHIPIRGLRDHSTHRDGTRNLMEPTNTATGEHLTPAQCVEVRNNI